MLVLVVLTAKTARADIPDTLKTLTVRGELAFVVNAFERLALVMSDARYRGLFFGVIVLFIVGGAFAILGKMLFSGRPSPWPWVWLFGTVIAGVTAYHAFLSSTTTITITDETIGGKWKTVDGVPDGVAFIAG